MAQTGYTPISIYYSTTGSAVPVNTNLVNGELAINITDGKLFYKDNGGTVQLLASKAGASGDVVGPASATDNAVVRFDGTTGKLVQNSAVTIADTTGDITTSGYVFTALGAAANPSYSFSGDPNTGVFSSGADTVNIGTGGAERMRIDNAGAVGIGGTPAAANTLLIARNSTGATSTNGIAFNQTILSDVTGNFRGIQTGFNTQAASFTLSNLSHVYASQGTFNSPSVVTNQYGFLAESTLTGATNNYGFFSNIASGTGRWNFYAAGTANNYFAGKIGLGATPDAVSVITQFGTVTGGTGGYLFNSNITAASDVTSSMTGYSSYINTAAAAFTLTNIRHFSADQGTIGASSAVTNQYGFIANSTLTGATNNYGFYGNIASGSGRWNLYMNGTAENYMAGNLKIGATTARGTTAGTNHLSLFNGTAPAGTLTNGVTLYSASGDFNFMDSSGNGFKVGFRNIPAVGTKTGSYTLATGDVGKYVQVGSGGSITIPDATFAEGDVISIFNNTTGNITITCTITTAYIAGTDADKASVTLATRGVATILFISSTVCVISGNVT